MLLSRKFIFPFPPTTLTLIVAYSKYITGLEDWVVGNLDWSFATQRYFGKNHATVKETLVVDLYPLRTA